MFKRRALTHPATGKPNFSGTRIYTDYERKTKIHGQTNKY